jgi:hypothetical protein
MRAGGLPRADAVILLKELLSIMLSFIFLFIFLFNSFSLKRTLQTFIK